MKRELRYAFLKTVPVMCGYIFLGIAFGILFLSEGYGALWSFVASSLIYAGSMQFAMCSFIGGGMSFVSMALMTFLINSRHIFYGITFLEKFKKTGRAYPYMVFSLTDETYSLLCSEQVPPDMSEGRVMVLISALDQFYWVLGSVLGSLIGSALPFDWTGIDFAMTALFVVIFVEQWRGAKNHVSALVGVACGLVCLFIFGASNFILPAMVSSVIVLTLIGDKWEEAAEQ